MRAFRCGSSVGVLVLLCIPVQASLPSAGAGQSTAPKPGWRGSHGEKLGRLAGTLTVLYVGMELTDEPLRAWSQGPGFQGSRTLSGVTAAFDQLGSPVPIVMLGASYLLAGATGRAEGQDIALHVGSGVVFSATTAMALKALFGRARPHVSAEDADIFDPSRGIRADADYNSFPSGHTTVAFALAAGLAGEAEHRWPGAARGIEVVSYAAAGLTGVARIYKDRHWGTDVLVGAVLGHWIASKVVSRAHEHGVRSLDGLPFIGADGLDGIAAGITLRFD